MPSAYIIARRAISYRRYITRSDRNGYHCKKPLLSGRQKRFFTWCRWRDLILARTARSVFHGRGRPPEVRSVPFPLQIPPLYKAKWQSRKDSAISLGAGDGIWTHTNLFTGTWNQRVCRSATPAFLVFCPLFLHGENARGGAYIRLKPTNRLSSPLNDIIKLLICQ